MIALVLAIFLLGLTFFLYSREGMKEPFLSTTIESIESAMKDERMNSKQKMALQDALVYAKYIKNIGTI